ncbi:MAG: hypothetical protein IJL99_04455 [Firmicutes bacterium]|nr:hypothetical protein [Bacillota bacterium]
MRQIILKPTLEFGSRCDFAIIDVTECAKASAANPSGGKQRGTITIDYSPADIRQLLAESKDLTGALDYYRTRIYDLVKYYISGDWECVQGFDEAIDIITKHIGSSFE